jgi:branched-chain amino acid transport system substrate-binding protein
MSRDGTGDGSVENRTTSRRRFLYGAGAVGASLGLAGCAAGPNQSAETTTSGGGGDTEGTTTGDSGDGMETIRLGGSMSLSGDNADLGVLYRDAYEATIERINEAGGVEAGDGTTYELEMVLRDDETDAAKSKRIYQELIDREGIQYLLGPYSSTVTLPASAVAASNEVPMVEGGGASPEIFSQGNEWIYGLLPTADKYPLSGIEMAAAQSSAPESAALLAEDDTFSQSTAEGARAKFEEAGIDLVVDETFPTETSDLSTQLGKVRSEDADVLLLAAHQKHSIIMAKQLESQQVNVDMAMGTVGTLNDAFKEEVGANGNYIYGPSSWASNASFEDRVFGTTGDFVSAIQSEYDYMPDYHSAAATGVVQTFVRAFESVDEVAPTPVRDAIQNIDFTCAYGGVRFADNGVINKDMLVYQWQPDGGRSIVWPENVQQTAPKYPMPSWSER